jgi:hypothetical protein
MADDGDLLFAARDLKKNWRFLWKTTFQGECQTLIVWDDAKSIVVIYATSQIIADALRCNFIEAFFYKWAPKAQQYAANQCASRDESYDLWEDFFNTKLPWNVKITLATEADNYDHDITEWLLPDPHVYFSTQQKGKGKQHNKGDGKDGNWFNNKGKDGWKGSGKDKGKSKGKDYNNKGKDNYKGKDKGNHDHTWQAQQQQQQHQPPPQQASSSYSTSHDPWHQPKQQPRDDYSNVPPPKQGQTQRDDYQAGYFPERDYPGGNSWAGYRQDQPAMVKSEAPATEQTVKSEAATDDQWDRWSDAQSDARSQQVNWKND